MTRVAVVVLVLAGCGRSAVLDDSGFCTTTVDCVTDAPCQTAVCEANRCVVRRASNGAPCDDGRYCSVNDICISGECVGTQRYCGALDTDCTIGECSEEAQACVATPQRTPGTEGPHGVATCSDGSDNDCDGAVDEDDAGCAQREWWDTTYAKRAQVSIDARALGKNLSGFPVAVRFSDSSLGALARKSVRFIADDGTTSLPFERERMADGDLFWVRVPTITAVSGQGFFFAYFRDSVADDPVESGVWDNDFVGVWHMQGDSATVVRDSTRYAKNGAAIGYEASLVVETPTGFGYQLDGGAIRVPSPTLSDPLALTDTFTLEAWLAPDAGRTGYWQGIVSRQYGNDIDDAWFLMSHVYTRQYRAFAPEAGLALAHEAVPVDRYSATSRDTGNLHLYVDGARRRSAAISDAPRTDINDVILGAVENGPTSALNEFFQGTLDEVRISRVRRSDDSIRASNANIRDALVSIGPLETY